jgi:diguanylate cyclase (GGDEF)-like protein
MAFIRQGLTADGPNMKPEKSGKVVTLPEAARGTAQRRGPDFRTPGAVAHALASFSEADLAPEVRREFDRLAAEADALRLELELTRQRVELLEELADRDALVPTLNRRAFVRELHRMSGFAERYGVAGSVLFFDINGLKQINDAYGHATGDLALRHVANVLLSSVRASDVVGRLGGDEFGVILTQSTGDSARLKAAHLAKAVAAQPIDCKGGKIFIQVAYGVQSLTAGEAVEEALDRADRNMYAQKRALRKSRKK